MDTNVLFAAIITPNGTPKRLLEAYLAGAFTLLVSPAQLREIRRVSRYPTIVKYTTKVARGALVNLLETRATLIRCHTVKGLCEDPYDDFLLTLALKGEADYLVSRDGLVGNVKRIGRCAVVKPETLYRRLDKKHKRRITNPG